MPRNFWMINCNRQNFDITRSLGFRQQGLKAEYRRKAQRVEAGDRIIYYVSGVRAFTATATVTQGYEEVSSSPWVKEGRTPWPWRIGIRPGIVLNREQYIDAGLIAYRLEYLRKWPPEDWYLAFQGNLHLLSKGDFFLLESEMLKLRDGREEAIRKIDAELVAEEERVNAMRERRRLAAERNAARPPARPRVARPMEDATRQPDEPEEANPMPATAGYEPPADPSGRTRSGGRNRRHQKRLRGRRASAQQPEHDAN